jgi:hypothetical protein
MAETVSFFLIHLHSSQILAPWLAPDSFLVAEKALLRRLKQPFVDGLGAPFGLPAVRRRFTHASGIFFYDSSRDFCWSSTQMTKIFLCFFLSEMHFSTF